MGCDIHWVVEQKYENKWIGVRRSEYVALLAPVDGLPFQVQPAKSRDYSLFAKLAGVRAERHYDHPKPRGIPADVSELAQMMIDSDGPDGHSHSWGLFSEVLPLFKESHARTLVEHKLAAGARALDTSEIAEWLFGTTFDGSCGFDDYRLVYWFDN